jgi:mono/diheme cytochrome c family protein
MSVRALWVLGLLLVRTLSIASAETLVERGEYLFRAGGCAGCHTDVDNKGPFLAGGRAIQSPFGTFYTPNITPHPTSGIGHWDEAAFIQAMTRGVSPEGAHYYPAFPYTSYTRIKREDLRALKAYLFSVPAVAQPNKPHDLPWYLSYRPLIGLWKRLFFTPGEFHPRPDRSPEWNRGAYLATALAHCAECHTPRNFLGGLRQSLAYAGTRDGPEGELIPNITPDRETGIGRWTLDDIAYYLETGATPDGDYAGSLMAEAIDEGLRYLSTDDLEAIATYIMSLTPIHNAIKKKPR